MAGFFYRGGAIYHTNGYVLIFNSTFSNNQLGIATTLSGGAVYINAGKATIANSYFTENIAGGHGGAVVGFSDQFIITSSYFINNTVRSNSSHGGALYVSNVTITTAISVTMELDQSVVVVELFMQLEEVLM